MIEIKTPNIYQKLLNIQTELKAPKNQYNSFGKYNYRNSEDILEALKPLLNKNKTTVIISDKPIAVGNRVYIQATVKFIDVETGEAVETTAMAREEETKKGMDSSQITGSSSSYARKYALNGMFCIDDTKDSDTVIEDNTEASNDNKSNVSDLDQEILSKVKNILYIVAEKNENKALALLETHTTFTSKEGKVVKGIRDFNKLTNGRLKATYGNLKRIYPDIYKLVNEAMKKKKEAS